MLCVVVICGLALAQPPDPLDSGGWPRQSNGVETAQDTQLLREGTRIVDQLGSFQLIGERATFLADDGTRRFVSLENLNLERIVRAIEEIPVKLQWSVTGTITEYRGDNFLTVEHAVLASKDGPPSPDAPYPQD